MREPPLVDQAQPYNSDYNSTMEDGIYEKTVVILEKTRPNQGFGIAISGGKDNPRYKTGSTAIVVSDIVEGSPADGLLRLNDEILSVNQVVVENAPHNVAVNALKHAGNQAQIVVRRQRTAPPSPAVPQQEYVPVNNGPPQQVTPVGYPQPDRRSTPRSTPKGTPRGTPKMDRRPEEVQLAVNGQGPAPVQQQPPAQTVSHPQPIAVQAGAKPGAEDTFTVTLDKGSTGYGFALGTKIFVRDLAANGPAVASGLVEIGDLVLEINGQNLDNIRSVNDAIEIVRNAGGQVTLLLQRKKYDAQPVPVVAQPAVAPSVPPSQPVAQQVQQTTKPTPSPRNTPKSQRSEPKKQEQPSQKPPQEAAVVPKEIQKVEAAADMQKTWKSPNPMAKQDVEDGNVTRDSWDAASPLARYAAVDVSAQPDALHAMDSGRWDKRRMERIREHRRSQGHEGRLITFVKSGSLGVQVAGGNATGIFVAAVRGDSAAYKAGLRQGDMILMANDIDFQDITREEAVLILLALGEEVTMLVEHNDKKFEEVKSQLGDNFFVRANFEHFEKSNPNELTFTKGEVFNIRDTMYQGLIGAWQAQRIGKNGQPLDHGILPNKSRAEQMAIAQRMEEKIPLNSPFRKSLQRRGSTGGSLRRAKYKFISQDKLDENSFLIEGLQIPAYERVVLRCADFMRPVIILGPLADLVRLRLLDEMPDRFDVPASTDSFGYKSNTLPRNPATYNPSFGDSIKLSEVRQVIAENKHCLLEVTPEGVEMLMYAQLCPIVILLKTISKAAVKDMRQSLVGELQRSPTGVINLDGDPLLWKQVRKVYSMSKKLEEVYPHIFTAKINTHIAGASSVGREWYYKLKEIIFKQQAEAAWMPEEKPEETLMDDMVFRPPNYMSYMSGGESDTEGESVKSESPTMHKRAFEDSQSHSPPRTPPAETPPYRPPQRKELVEDAVPVAREAAPVHSEPPPPQVTSQTHTQISETVTVTTEETVQYVAPTDEEEGSTGYVFGTGPEEKRDLPVLQDPSVPLPEVLPEPELEKKKPGSVKVYPSQFSARDARQSLKHREGMQREKSPSEVEDYETTLKRQAEALRKVSDDDDPTFRDLDDRAGVKVSEILKVQDPPITYTKEYAVEAAPPRRTEAAPPRRTPPASSSPVPRGASASPHTRSATDSPVEPPPLRPPAPRNYIVDVRRHGSGKEMVAQSTFIQPTRVDVERVNINPPRPVNETAKATTQEDVEAALDDLMDIAMSPPERPPKTRPSQDAYQPPPARESRPPPPSYDYQPSSRDTRAPPPSDYRGSRKSDYPPPPRDPRPPSPSEFPPPPRGGRPSASDYPPPPREDAPQKVPPPVARKPNWRGGREEVPPPPRTSSRDVALNRDEYRPGPPSYGERSPKMYKREDQLREFGSRDDVYDDEPKVVATARGIFDHRGGLLESTETGVSIYIPAGALPEGKKQEVYFKVCQDSKYMPTLDSDGGETLLSPLVMCGPHGLKFKKPIELRLPHKGNSSDQMTFSLKSSDSPIVGHPGQLRNVQLGGRDLDASRAYQVTDDTVSVLVDHF